MARGEEGTRREVEGVGRLCGEGRPCFRHLGGPGGVVTAEGEWYDTVVEGGRRFVDAWRRIEEQAFETRQEKRVDKYIGNAPVTPKVAVGYNTDWVLP